MERKSDALCEYAFQVGLRCPDSRTLLVMCALLHLECGKNVDRCTLCLRSRELAEKFKKYRVRYEKIYGRLATPDACLETMTCPDAVPCQVDEANLLEIVIPGRSTNACMSKTNVASGESKMLDLLMRLASFSSPSVTSPTVALVQAPSMTSGSLMPTPPAPSRPALPNMPAPNTSPEPETMLAIENGRVSWYLCRMFFFVFFVSLYKLMSHVFLCFFVSLYKCYVACFSVFVCVFE